MATTISEVLRMRWLLSILQATQHGLRPLFCDNRTARHISNNRIFHERTKNVKMDYYFVRKRVESKEIKPCTIDMKAQVVDLFTKALRKDSLSSLANKLDI